MNKSTLPYNKIYTDVNNQIVNKKLAYKGCYYAKNISLDNYQYNVDAILNHDLLNIIITLLHCDTITLYQLYLTSKIFHHFVSKISKLVINTNYTFNYSLLFKNIKQINLYNQRYDYKLKTHLYKKFTHLCLLLQYDILQQINIVDCRFKQKQLNQLIKLVDINKNVTDVCITYKHLNKYNIKSKCIYDLFLINHLTDVTCNNVVFTDYI